MPFLKRIDDEYAANRCHFSIPGSNREFSCDIPLRITDGTVSYDYLIRKSEKSKALLLSGKQKVYLSDLQIIKTIVAMDEEETDWFIRRFVELYNCKGKPIYLELCGETYEYTGIAPYPEKKELYLLTDTIIDYSYFVFLLNFIFCKDQCWEVMGNEVGFGKTTLCKYISLIDYYKRNNKQSKSFLQRIGYPPEIPISASEEVLQQAFLQFEDINCIKQFDISKYQ